MKTYIASKVIVKHPWDKKILLIKRKIHDTFFYETAGGRVEVDFKNHQVETLEQCAERESKEELGLSIYDLHYLASYHFFWTIKDDVCSICAVFLAKAKNIDLMKITTYDSCYQIYPEWTTLDLAIKKQLKIGENHIGLADIIKKAALMIKNNIY